MGELPNRVRGRAPWGEKRRSGGSAASRFCGRETGEGAGVFGDGPWDHAVVDELAFTAALDEAGIGENFEVMGNGGRGDAAEGNQVSADHFLFFGDGLKDHEAGGVGQSLGNPVNTGAVHGEERSVAAPPGNGKGPGRTGLKI